MKPARQKSWGVLGLALPAAVFLGAWLINHKGDEPRPATAPDHAAATLVQATPRAPEPATVLAAAPLPIRDPGPIDSHSGPVHPHPMTPERDRIQRENQQLGRLNDAMDLADAPSLARELARYEQDYPDDPNQLQGGYRVILACLENPGPESTAAAQRYYDEERGSTLRRFVARHCLGG